MSACRHLGRVDPGLGQTRTRAAQAIHHSQQTPRTHHEVALRLAIGLDRVVEDVVPVAGLGFEQLALHACVAEFGLVR